MKKNLLFGAFIFYSSFIFSQQNWCGFDANNAKLNQENPGRELLIHEKMSSISEQEIFGNDRSVITIPVVVHVIHDGGSSNISYEQIVSGIDMLNEDFQRLNADTADTRNTTNAPWLPIAANVGIEFALAKIDPDGNCTNGVQRRYSPSTTMNADDNAKHYNSGGLDAWDRNDYFNIWVVESINSEGVEGYILGYAEFPYSGGSSNYGIIIRNDAYGNLGTANGDRTLTHEVGHCLGLLHTFQGGCHSDQCSDNGDYCCDTPPESEAFWSCLPNQNSCTDVPVNDLYGFDAYDQWENYMSYAPCQNMYSKDQKNIILFNLTDINFLANLTSPANIIATGVNNPDELCMASFTTSNTVICSGSTVQFFDASYSNVTGRSWTFAGGTPASSTNQNPIITFNTEGIYDVILEVTDGVSIVSTTESEIVIVLASPGESLPYSEGFEDYASLPDNQNFLIENEIGYAWDITSAASYGGDQSIKLRNFAQSNGTIDEFISGTIDLSGVPSTEAMIFNFKYAYKKRTIANDEWLKFYISKDCGATWVLRQNLHGDQLSELTLSSPYTPDEMTEWTQVNVTNINSAYYVEGFRYKFVFENDNGNNIYIDNINLYPASMTEIEELETNVGLSVYPNPTSDFVQIYFSTLTDSNCKIYIQNALGQLVTLVYEGATSVGANKFEYSITNLQSGVYFITVESEGSKETIKFIKK